jgi:biotin carboxyl carrier protein
MSEIKILTEVAGRVCAIPAVVGVAVSDGDDLVLVEAMKMEIPVPTTTGGKIRSILVKIDDIVEEGQAIAIVES